jgi:hypothetical protein
LYGPILYGGVTLANLIAARQGAPHTNSTLRIPAVRFPGSLRPSRYIHGVSRRRTPSAMRPRGSSTGRVCSR